MAQQCRYENEGTHSSAPRCWRRTDGRVAGSGTFYLPSMRRKVEVRARVGTSSFPARPSGKTALHHDMNRSLHCYDQRRESSFERGNRFFVPKTLTKPLFNASLRHRSVTGILNRSRNHTMFGRTPLRFVQQLPQGSRADESEAVTSRNSLKGNAKSFLQRAREPRR